MSGTILDRDAAGSVIDAAAGKITSASYRVRSSDVTGSIDVANDGGFSVDIDTTSFSRTITIEISATDYAGNTSVESLQLFYDAQGPTITVTSPEALSNFGAEVTVEGTVTNSHGEGTGDVAELSYEVADTTIGGELEFGDEDGAFSFTFSAEGITGDLVIRLMAADLHGDSTTVSLQLVNDGIGPYIHVTSPEDYSYYATVLDLTGTVTNSETDSDTSEVAGDLRYEILGTSVAGTTDIDLEDGSFSTTIDVAALSGNRALEVRAADKNGNERVITINILKAAGDSDVAGFTVTPGNKQVTLEWEPVAHAESYTIHNPRYGEIRDDVTSPYSWDGLSNGSCTVSRFRPCCLTGRVRMRGRASRR